MNQQYASNWQRYVAYLVDSFLVGLVYIGPTIFLVATGKKEIITQWAFVFQVLAFLVNFGYYVVYQAKTGQTIGKKTMGIKVVMADGKTPSMMTFFLREIVGKFVSAIILFIGYIMILWDKNKQGLHDKIAGTFVVKVTASTAPVIQTAPTQSAQSDQTANQAPSAVPQAPQG